MVSVPPGELLTRYGPALVAPMTQPLATTALTTPVPPGDSMTNGLANPLDVLNYASTTAWLNELISALTGQDVMAPVRLRGGGSAGEGAADVPKRVPRTGTVACRVGGRS